MADPVLTTRRLRWRRSRPADLDAFHALVSDREMVKNTATWPWPPERAFTAARVAPFPLENGLVGLVFCGAELVGAMGVSAGGAGGEMGYMFARAHWGRGFATEIGRALLAEAFARYDWPVIEACAFEGNPASSRVLEKLGFTEIGRSVGPCAARGCALPMRCFRLARSPGG